MTDDDVSSRAGATASGEATIQLWRTKNRIWPGFPTLLLARSASGASLAVGEGGVVAVFLDGSKLGTISPDQVQVYSVAVGEHSLSLHFLGGLRRSRKLRFALAQGEIARFICLLNSVAWPSIRPASPGDVTAMEHRPASNDSPES
ncbi:MAG TPA: hypothetical protein VMF33_05680 [Acidimicrobiales bacterium]|nr:hypothetical protein [Acidimicrobiales bacterium]